MTKNKKTREQIQEQMHGSNMHRRIFEEVGRIASGNMPVYFDREFILEMTIPDLYFPRQRLAIYIDGPVHRGKQVEKDEELRTMLESKRKLNVAVLKYDSDTDGEFQRLMAEIQKLIDIEDLRK